MRSTHSVVLAILFSVVLSSVSYAGQLSVCAPEVVGMASETLARVSTVVQDLVDQEKIAGASVLVARRDKVAFFETFGMMDKAGEKPVTEDTIFRFYSMTKPVTSVAVMMLVEQGKIELDAPVSRYIAAFKDLKVYDEAGTPAAAIREMTVRDLLRHTSGLTYGFFGNTPVDKLYLQKGVLNRNATLSDMARQLGDIPLLYQPGTRWHYSVATDVLGHLVETVSGRSLDAFFQERLFEPLGMADTAFYVPAEKVDRFAVCYGPRGHVKDKPKDSEFLTPPSQPSGGGGLVSTIGDYFKFCRMLLNEGELNGRRLLLAETVEAMTRDQLPEGTSWNGQGFGLGFSVRTTEGRDNTGEYGWGGAASTHFWINPRQDLIVIALSQLMPYSGQLETAVKPLVYEAIVKPSTPKTDGRVGANYTPAYAVNQVQFWHDFRAEVVEKELAAAKKYFGISTLRVYLHNINFDEERDVFLANLETFLTLCDRYGIKPGFVFFDDCHRDSNIFLDRPTAPIKGYHNGRWAQCPQKRHRDPENLQRFKPYVQTVIRAHRTDARVLWWEIYNEPRMRDPYSVRLRTAGYAWAKAVEPVQPVLNCWDDSDVTDIVDAHNYGWNPKAWDRQADMNPEKGTVFTEAGARWYAPRASNGEPCEIMDWLERRRTSGQSTPGVYLCWELMVGHSNCRWYWGTPEQTPEPTVPWCGLLWPDATPVSLAEAEAVHRYVTGETRALFFDDFQKAPSPVTYPGWTAYGGVGQGASGVLQVPAGMKRVTGDAAWTDYVLEGRVMLKSEANGNAGLIFRVNDAGPGPDQMRGYYVGFDTQKLYLGKMEDNWQPLAEFDLGKLDCKVIPGVWNQIRVAVKGPRIRVWFNRMHDSEDPDRGLRLDVIDKKTPVLSGAVGVRAHAVDAWFDNIVVLPVGGVQ